MKPTPPIHSPLPSLLAACAFVVTSTAAAPLTLVRDGTTDYVLVVATEASEAENYAAEELTHFVARATGATLPVVDETAHAGGLAIYLGRTAFAARQGIDFNSLAREEWVLRAAGNDLILTGDRPRGTLYGVYAFLEDQLGVRFLDPYTEHVPRVQTLAVAGDLDVRNAPAFSRREIYTVVNGHGPEPWTIFQVRRRINCFANAWRMIAGKYGYSIKYGSPYTTHTHYRYVEDFPEAFDKPEYFALTTRGNRHHNQPCMSHPEVRKIFTESLREYIRRDREALLAEGREPDAFPRYYALTPNDGTSGKCVCERCLVLAEKHNSYAGVVLDFANAIGEAIAEDFPEIMLRQGAAYLYYRDVPTGIRPRENVFLSIAQWPALHPRRDHIRSVFHPLNAEPRKEFEAWADIGVRGMHDYWKWGISGPQAFVRELADTLKFYHHHGVRHFLTENFLRGTRLHNFVDLQFYMASRLLVDPTQTVEPMIDEFMALYYGPAAPHMEALLEYLEARKDLDESYLWAIPLSARAAFEPAFFVQTDAILSKAEAAVADNPTVLANVRQERLPIDEAMLNLWHGLAASTGNDWPFDRAQVLKRLERNYDHGWEKYGGRPHANHAWVVADRQRLDYLRDMPPIPPPFEGRELIDLCGPRLVLTRARRVPTGTVEDPEAATGRAWRLGAHRSSSAQPDVLLPVDHDAAPRVGLSDVVTEPRFESVHRRLAPEEIPRDETYHWYRVGRMQATQHMYFSAHESWVFDTRLGSAYNAALPDQNFYDVYVSLKLEGPAYVPGSERENAFSIDRLILVQVDPDEPEIPFDGTR